MTQDRKQAEELELELQGEMERLGIKTDWRMDCLPLMTDDMVMALRDPAQQLRPRANAWRRRSDRSRRVRRKASGCSSNWMRGCNRWDRRT